MNRINKLFLDRQKPILSIYFCAGTPDPEATVDVVRTLELRGVDMVEIGIPFSDPLADGPVIQGASTQALRQGMTLSRLMGQLAGLRPAGVSIPVVLMGYLNPVLQYGFERFCRECKACGVDGVIIPDLPFDEYMRDFRPTAERYDLKFILLITPETSEARIRQIDAHTDSFLYMVSFASVTGAQKDFDEARQKYFRRIADMHLRSPRLIGFGISNRQTYETATRYADGVIVGSRFVTLLEAYGGDAGKAIDALHEALRHD